MTRGREICNSNPSRRIFSINIDKCNSPRPDTTHASGESVGSTRRLTSVSSCVFSLSSILAEVIYFPSLPAKDYCSPQTSSVMLVRQYEEEVMLPGGQLGKRSPQC